MKLHEAAHTLATQRGIKDTSAAGNRYHNKRFAALAAELGLRSPDTPDKITGWSSCTLTDLAEYLDLSSVISSMASSCTPSRAACSPARRTGLGARMAPPLPGPGRRRHRAGNRLRNQRPRPAHHLGRHRPPARRAHLLCPRHPRRTGRHRDHHHQRRRPPQRGRGRGHLPADRAHRPRRAQAPRIRLPIPRLAPVLARRHHRPAQDRRHPPAQQPTATDMPHLTSPGRWQRGRGTGDDHARQMACRFVK